jgi:hypothetical protein
MAAPTPDNDLTVPPTAAGNLAPCDESGPAHDTQTDSYTRGIRGMSQTPSPPNGTDSALGDTGDTGVVRPRRSPHRSPEHHPPAAGQSRIHPPYGIFHESALGGSDHAVRGPNDLRGLHSRWHDELRPRLAHRRRAIPAEVPDAGVADRPHRPRRRLRRRDENRTCIASRPERGCRPIRESVERQNIWERSFPTRATRNPPWLARSRGSTAASQRLGECALIHQCNLPLTWITLNVKVLRCTRRLDHDHD